MKQQKHKYTAWIVLTIFSLSFYVSSGGSFLCIDDEGHSKIEQSVDSCCDLGIASKDRKLLATDVHEDVGCGDCDDIEISVIVSYRFTSEHGNYSQHLVILPVYYNYSRELASKGFSEKNDCFFTFSPTVSQLSVSKTVFIC